MDTYMICGPTMARFGAMAAGLLLVFGVSTANAITMVSEVESNDSFASGQVIGAHDGSLDITGSIFPVVDVDHFRFIGTSGDNATFETTLLTLVDSTLSLFNPAGSLLASDDDGGVGLASRIDILLPTTGLYSIAVNPFNPLQTGTYLLEIRGLTPVSETVPEPTTLIILSLGLAGLGFVRQRKTI